MTAGNDIVIAVTCGTFETILASLMAESILPEPEYTMRNQIMMRPRFSLLIDCPDCTR